MGSPNHRSHSHHRHHRHGTGLILLLLTLVAPGGCTSSVNNTGPAADAPRIRVRLLAGADNITLSCGVPPLYQLSNQTVSQPLNCPKNAIFTLTLTPQGWMAGKANLGGTLGTTLHLQPDHDGTVSVNGVAYRGKFRFIPVGGTKFDVINALDVDSYLASVVPKEM